MVAAEVALLFQHRLPQLCSKLLILPGHTSALSAKGCQRSIVLQRVPAPPDSIQRSSPPPAPAHAQAGLSEGCTHTSGCVWTGAISSRQSLRA